VGSQSKALVMKPVARRNVAGMPLAKISCSRSRRQRPIAGTGSPMAA
jgi:hypothetical protein